VNANYRTPASRVILRLLVLALLLAATACANVQPPHRDHLDAADARLAQCAQWFEALDAAVARSGVADIEARRVKGFPYLRIDRFLASMKQAARDDARLRNAWIAEMRARDADGRRVEIANLPDAQVDRLGANNRHELAQRTQQCAQRLLAADVADASAHASLYRRAFVADDYSTLKRGLGLYELTRIPFHAGVEAWQEDTEETFAQARRGELPSAALRRYVPPSTPVFERQQVAAILARATTHPLGLPRLSAVERERLFATYAPVFEIETGGDFDRIGRLGWDAALAPRVDVAQPVVYRRLGYTRSGQRTLLQLVYVAWMPERPLDSNFDVLGGHLDGVVWRVTLAPDGEPVLFDSIHPCGCYHMFFPTPRLQPLPAPQLSMEWAFTPVALPPIAESERLVVTLRTRSHYLANVRPATAGMGTGTAYDFAEYDELRTLPLPQGGTRSLFGPDGLVAGTERGERFLFWPMGIASPGAMRQSGSQATAFVGRRHFDDADILEKRFRLRY
jgi:hypothetical protein